MLRIHLIESGFFVFKKAETKTTTEKIKSGRASEGDFKPDQNKKFEAKYRRLELESFEFFPKTHRTKIKIELTTRKIVVAW